MPWRVKTYETKRGEKPVDEFIKSCDSQIIPKISHVIDLLETHGHLLRMPHSKKLTSEIYELRARGKQEIRITYAFKGRTIWLLHVFKKQTQKTPAREISTSEKRLLGIDGL
ncbi:MAG: hypothetical protein G01um10145_302 [Microgenomates group bacterium Gr01-1014_5]|nr:MAG: hypothetical protein G01um10145_302 [Microgenomates group bacterium Gr01-1014_5]